MAETSEFCQIHLENILLILAPPLDTSCSDTIAYCCEDIRDLLGDDVIHFCQTRTHQGVVAT